MSVVFSVGHPVLDQDHEELFQIIQRLDGLSNSTHDERDLNNLLKELIEHFTSHFSREELIMRQTSYPEADEHSQIHAQLSEIFYEQLLDLDDLHNALDSVAKTMESHIKTEDFKYAEFVRLKQCRR